MKRTDRLARVAGTALLAASLSAPAKARTLDAQQLLMLQSTVASICTTVSTNGKLVNAALEGGLKARVATVLAKVIPIDASVNGSISKTSWSGVAQKDSGDVLKANIACRQDVSAKLLAIMLEPEPPPAPAPKAAPQPHAKAPPARKPATRPAAALLPAVAAGTPAATARDAAAAAEKAAGRGDFKTALGHWLAAAQLGDARAQFEAAQIYDYGARGVRADCAKATQWYKAAAAQNLAAANYNVGGEYYYGCKGVFAADHAEALRWLHKAVEGGSPDAEYEIGMIYYNGGAGVGQDRALAKTWLAKAAAHGYPLADQVLRTFSPA